MTLSGNTGYPALRKLLAAKDGDYAFMDVTEEPVTEVNQSLGVDILALLETVDFKLEKIPLSAEALTGHAGKGEQITLINTDPHMEPFDEGLTEPDRVRRINQTYEKVLSLSEYKRAVAGTLQATNPEEDFPEEDYIGMRATAPSPIVPTEIGGEESEVSAGDDNDETRRDAEFKRLRDWNDKSQVLNKVAWAFIFLSIIVFLVIFGRNIATIVGGVIRHK